MTDQETNHYKLALAAAKSTIADERDGLTEGGSMTAGIGSSVTNGGWVCPQADTWFAELVERCTPVSAAFDAAIDEVHAAWKPELDDVDAGHWKGEAFLSQSRRHPGMPPA